jgi:RNA recognition motif-containing protein
MVINGSGASTAAAAALIPTKLYVTNFPFTCTQRQIAELFSRFGQVVECTLKKDYYAYILYTSARGAQQAFKNANGLRMMGRKLTVHLATSKKSQSHLNHPITNNTTTTS